MRNMKRILRLGSGMVLMSWLAVTVGCAANTEVAGQNDSRWMTEEEMGAIEAIDYVHKMHGRHDIQMRSVAEGDAALAYALVIEDLAKMDGLAREALELGKYHVLYGLKGDLSLVYFRIRDDFHDQVGLKDSDGNFIKRMTNYPYIEYWIDRRTWKIAAKSEHPF